MALSVNEMRKAFYKFGSNPDQISLERIKDALSDSFPMNPMSGAVIWVLILDVTVHFCDSHYRADRRTKQRP